MQFLNFPATILLLTSILSVNALPTRVVHNPAIEARDISSDAEKFENTMAVRREVVPPYTQNFEKLSVARREVGKVLHRSI